MELSRVKILIFDVDGVLVYVGDSYRKAIIETVQYYFSNLIGLKLDRYLMTQKDTQNFKLAGGFNDDWELTYAAVLCYLTNLVSKFNYGDVKAELQAGNPGNLDDMAESLKKIGTNVTVDFKLDLEAITSKIKKNGGGIKGTEEALNEIFGKNKEIARKFLFTGLIKRVFQEFYLGEKFFEDKYGEKPRFIRSEGLVRNEKALITTKTMEGLSKKFYLGVSTGRERFEVETTMKIHEFDKFFAKEAIVAREDTKIRKPNPSSLLECRKRICGRYNLDKETNAAYAGDIPDDVRAAKNAGFYSIGCLSAVSGSGDKERLKREFHDLKCDLVLDNAEELKKYIK